MDKLLKLQSEIGAIQKDKTNPFYHSQYFDINAVIEQIMPKLKENGITILQPLTTVDGKAAIKTIVFVDDKEVINESVVLPENSDPQKMGSAITYYRRYALQSLLLLQAEDDDANSSINREPIKNTRRI